MWECLPLVNLLLCTGIAWSCLCRLNSELCRRYLAPRARYTAMLAGATACGLQPVMWGEQPGIGTVMLTASVALSLAISATWWPVPENTPPADCETCEDLCK